MRALFRGVVGAGLLAVSTVLTASACWAQDPKKLGVGDPFPDVAVAATQAGLLKKDAKTVNVKDLKGKFVVVAFYPKALTGG